MLSCNTEIGFRGSLSYLFAFTGMRQLGGLQIYNEFRRPLFNDLFGFGFGNGLVVNEMNVIQLKANSTKRRCAFQVSGKSLSKIAFLVGELTRLLTV